MAGGFTQVRGHHMDSVCHPLSPLTCRPVRRTLATRSRFGSAIAGRVGAGGSAAAGAVRSTGAGGCSQPRKLGPLTVEMC